MLARTSHDAIVRLSGLLDELAPDLPIVPSVVGAISQPTPRGSKHTAASYRRC